MVYIIFPGYPNMHHKDKEVKRAVMYEGLSRSTGQAGVSLVLDLTVPTTYPNPKA
jgi:hypothetical protein